jgi:hypothetical protein
MNYEKEVEDNMKSFPTSMFLRWVLIADAATCIVTGLLMVLATNFLEQVLGLPVKLSIYAGISLFPFAALLAFLALRENVSPMSIWIVVILNALWSFDSILLVLTGRADFTGLGNAFVVTQAFAVAMFAYLEYVGLRKLSAASSEITA